MLIRHVLTSVQSAEPYGAAAVAVLALMTVSAVLCAVQQFLLHRTGEAVVFAARRRACVSRRRPECCRVSPDVNVDKVAVCSV